MPSWIIKAATQKAIGKLPQSHRWNELMQKYLTRGYYPGHKSFTKKLNRCRRHLDNYYTYSSSPKENFTALELGTGWWPIVPIGLYLCGADNIWTYDIVPHLRRDNLKRTIELFLEFSENGQLGNILKAIKPHRMNRLKDLLNRIEQKSPSDLLEEINVHLQVFDVSRSLLADKSIDLIYSTVVLEHIEAEKLELIFKEFKRVAADSCVMSNFIGLKDQYSDYDKSITPFNFLQFTDHKWQMFNNPIIPQSRLRINDYREIVKKSGWNIVEESNEYGSSKDLNKVKLAPKFRKYSNKDLLVLFSWLVSLSG